MRLKGMMQMSRLNAINAEKESKERHGDVKECIQLVRALKDCGESKDLVKGSKIHVDIVNRGLLETIPHVGGILVSMYANCGALDKSREVLTGLNLRNVATWNALISGYVKQKQGKEALNCFEYMRSEGISPNSITFVYILKACGSVRDVVKGDQIYDEIVEKGFLGKDIILGNALVDMYAKCGELKKAEKMLEKLVIRNVVSWNTIITGYTQQGQGSEALDCFERMQREGILPNSITFICISKACASIKAIEKGKKIHDEIMCKGLLGGDVVLGTALVDMYAKFGAMERAKEVFDDLVIPNIVSWNALIVGYVQHGQGEEALNCFKDMKSKGISPDAITFSSILKACANTGALMKGKQIHDDIVRNGLLGEDIVLDTALVDMYAKCGALRNAEQVFRKLRARNLVLWNTIIAAYSQQGHGETALNCFNYMQREGFTPDIITYVCIARACGSIGSADRCKQIHDEIVNKGLLRKDIILGNALVDMYAKCGLLEKAQRVLYELPIRDEVSWNALIAGYTQKGQGKEALECFRCMRNEGLSPDGITFISVLKACGSTGLVDFGKVIHEEILRKGLLAKDVVLGNALVDMYAKCGAFEKSQQVFCELPGRDIVSCNALIAGYVQHGRSEDALSYFDKLQTDGLSPDSVTYICILKACGNTGFLDKGKEIHNVILDKGFLGKDVFLDTALVDMYVKCGSLESAEQVFDEVILRDVVLWNALIVGYVQQGQGEEALKCFNLMQIEGLPPDAITFGCILKACGSAGAFGKGKQIHDEILCKGLLEKDTMLTTTLVDMYAKCGVMEKAEQVFDKICVHDVASWNSLIAGYALKGQIEEAVDCFKRMQTKGLSPDAVNFLCVMNACSHSGLVDEGEMCFMFMYRKYGIIPDLDHYTCMVDLFGRAGHFDKAVEVIVKMPSSHYFLVWDALLGACQKWGNVQLGRFAFEQKVQLDPNNGAAYVLMSNIYVAAGLKEDAEKIEVMQSKLCCSKQCMVHQVHGWI